MKKQKKYRTDFLFITPNFLMGAGSILNLAGNYFPFNYSKSDIEADNRAIEADWCVVGQDIENASNDFKNTHIENNVLANG